MIAISAADELTRDGGARVLVCPFLARVDDDRVSYPHGFTCGLRRRRASAAPSADELAWFCGNGYFRSCPTYARAEGDDQRPASAGHGEERCPTTP